MKSTHGPSEELLAPAARADAQGHRVPRTASRATAHTPSQADRDSDPEEQTTWRRDLARSRYDTGEEASVCSRHVTVHLASKNVKTLTNQGKGPRETKIRDQK